MPAENLIVQKSTRKKLLKLPIKTHKRLLEALKKIQENPISGFKLKGKLSEYYKWRIGDYRIVYTFDPKKSTVEVIKIEHRQGVYR